MKEFDRDEYISECYATPAHNVRRPHKHAELIKAWADGAEIEALFFNDARDYWTVVPNPAWSNVNLRFRIKPEPKPDVVLYQTIADCQPHPQGEFYAWASCCYSQIQLHSDGAPNVKLTFDGETGELKSAEVLK